MRIGSAAPGQTVPTATNIVPAGMAIPAEQTETNRLRVRHAILPAPTAGLADHGLPALMAILTALAGTKILAVTQIINQPKPKLAPPA